MRETFLISFSFLILACHQVFASSFGGGGTDPSIKLSLQNVADSTTSLRNDLNASTTAITSRADFNAISTTSLKNEINALHIATAFITARANQVAMTTTTQKQRLDNLDVSTGSVTGRVNQISIDTGATQMQVNALHLSTAAIFAGGATTYLNVSGSTQTKTGGLILNGSSIVGGKVGIGTSSPLWKFHIFELANATKMEMQEGSPIHGNVINFHSANNNDGYIGQDGFGMANVLQDAMLMATWSSKPLLFFTNQNERMRINEIGNIGIGTLAPSSKLDVFNGSITVRGTNAGINVKGGLSVSAPIDFGDNPSTGTILVYRGSDFLNANPIGNVNLFLGENTPSLGNGSSAANNTGIGYRSMSSIISGSLNTALGRDTLFGITSGNHNVAIGFFAGNSITTGNRNTFLGSQANSQGNLTNATAIGANALVSISSSMVLGGTGANSVFVGIGTTIPQAKFDVVNGSITVRGTNAGMEVSGLIKGNSIAVNNGSIFSKIQAGTAAIGSNGVSGVKTVTIIFPSAFFTPPKIILTPRGENYADSFSMTTRNIGTTSFQVNVQRTDSGLSSWGQNLQVDWFAWE